MYCHLLDLFRTTMLNPLFLFYVFYLEGDPGMWRGLRREFCRGDCNHKPKRAMRQKVKAKQKRQSGSWASSYQTPPFPLLSYPITRFFRFLSPRPLTRMRTCGLSICTLCLFVGGEGRGGGEGERVKYSSVGLGEGFLMLMGFWVLLFGFFERGGRERRRGVWV